MWINKIHSFLISPLTKTSRSRLIFWLVLSLAMGGIYGILSLQQAFNQPNLVQDDARQHVFWMLRFIDPDLFPNDLIANYFQSVAPAGYTTVYRIAAFLGINPLVFCRIIPVILTLISTVYFFCFCLELLPIPFTGFVGSLILNQVMWLKDDLASGTPRAFIYPIFTAFLYYLARKSILGVGITIGLIGLFYPQYIFVAAGMLILRIIYKRSWINLKISFLGLIITFIIILFYALKTSEFGPAITRAEAMQSLEFFPNGRSMFFHAEPLDFWLTGRRSGMFPKSIFTPVTQCLGLLFPVLMYFRSIFPMANQVTTKVWILFQLLISSITMFFLAHALLFKLHLPSRYTGLSLRLIMATITAIAITIVIDYLLTELESQKFDQFNSFKFLKSGLSFGLTSVILASLLLYPSWVPFFPLVEYKEGEAVEIYTFFQQQPKDIMIASLSGEVNQIPTFAQRSILVGREYMIPYQVGYYRQMNQRLVDLMQAHYSPSLEDLKTFIQTYGVDFFLMERYALTPEYFENNDWILEFEAGQQALQQLKTGTIPQLATTIDQCSAFENPAWIILDARCMVNL
ncbi:MAG: hypothetical protein WBA13_07565 [Microcoleaceae cyanobacterium]